MRKKLYPKRKWLRVSDICRCTHDQTDHGYVGCDICMCEEYKFMEKIEKEITL